jgi:hypothetical protein
VIPPTVERGYPDPDHDRRTETAAGDAVEKRLANLGYIE